VQISGSLPLVVSVFVPWRRTHAVSIRVRWQKGRRHSVVRNSLESVLVCIDQWLGAGWGEQR